MHLIIKVWNRLPKDVGDVGCQNIVSGRALVKVMEEKSIESYWAHIHLRNFLTLKIVWSQKTIKGKCHIWTWFWLFLETEHWAKRSFDLVQCGQLYVFMSLISIISQRCQVEKVVHLVTGLRVMGSLEFPEAIKHQETTFSSGRPSGAGR